MQGWSLSQQRDIEFKYDFWKTVPAVMSSDLEDIGAGHMTGDGSAVVCFRVNILEYKYLTGISLLRRAQDRNGDLTHFVPPSRIVAVLGFSQSFAVGGSLALRVLSSRFAACILSRFFTNELLYTLTGKKHTVQSA